jgi:hypothetical protein
MSTAAPADRDGPPVAASIAMAATIVASDVAGTTGPRRKSTYRFDRRHSAACASTSLQNHRLLLPDIFSAP